MYSNKDGNNMECDERCTPPMDGMDSGNVNTEQMVDAMFTEGGLYRLAENRVTNYQKMGMNAKTDGAEME